MLIDLSQALFSGMPVYPNDEPFRLIRRKVYAHDGYSAYAMSTGLHAGTHVDAPMHMTDDLRTIDQFPLDCFCGPGMLLEGVMPPADAMDIPVGSAVIFHTGMDRYYGTPAYYADHPVLSESLCRLLISRNVRIVGMDIPSPDYAPFQVHRLLLSAGIPIVENLTNLNKLIGKEFVFYAFPLRIASEASLVRAVAQV
jgi:kynurenine formamidase